MSSHNSSAQINWNRLCRDIAEKNVIPVLGNEMYNLTENSTWADVEAYFACQLLNKYGVTEGSLISIPAAVNYLIAEKGEDISDINFNMKEIDPPPGELPVLARFLTIDQFFFYVNTTVYGNILVSGLRQRRGKPAIEGNFSIDEAFVECGNIDNLEQPYVFNIFGTLTDNVAPALQEEEMLEFTTALIGKMSDTKFTPILDALKNKTLLFLGCRQPHWLIRFLYRIISNQRIDDWQRRRTNIIFVNDKPGEMEPELRFVQSHRAITYEGNTETFVTTLAEKWLDYTKANPPKPKNIFLSYSHKDKEAAAQMYKSISAIKNVHCWYDEAKLESGDRFEDEIIVNINEADMFIPLISLNSVAGDKTYVKREWDCGRNQNVMRSKKANRAGKYLLPIVIDDIGKNHDVIQQYFPMLTIDNLPGGNMNDQFINLVKKQLDLI